MLIMSKMQSTYRSCFAENFVNDSFFSRIQNNITHKILHTSNANATHGKKQNLYLKSVVNMNSKYKFIKIILFLQILKLPLPTEEVYPEKQMGCGDNYQIFQLNVMLSKYNQWHKI
eukprot:TRINITY_DN7938_c1_g1_i3.p3 TRINITY_DN7938_c1_g1~~TRINITY_DN7938_c1_g1_i3.p3  ORF type:complete len:116 (-),score=1.34 TRINITY_DN7938_c1_g1_i3:39-386(-)